MVAATAKAVAQTVAGVLGGRIRVRTHNDRDARHSVDVLSAADRPRAGFTAYSTVTLHLTPNRYRGKDIRVELLGVAAADRPDFELVISACGLALIKDRWAAAPGVVYTNVVDPAVSATMPHVLFSTPFPWDELVRFSAADQEVLGLLVCPISEAERQYLNAHGYDALEERVAEFDVSYFDLDRTSVV